MSELEKKKCPTLQKIRIDSMKKKISKLEEDVSNWKLRFYVVCALYIIFHVIDVVKLLRS